mmetsp:Transcript_31676/g.39041  ORF Transcript_31676/g.39041 Transcript_31676/m.39041 type:complete len:445 (-) Transcript_31676:265-1599(-)
MLFRFDMYIVLRSEDVKKVLVSSNYRSSLPILTKHMVQFLGKKSLVLLMNEEWKLHRRLLRSSFYHEDLFSSMMADVSGVVNQLIKYQTARIQASTTSSLSLDVLSMNKKITLDIIGLSAFNYRFNSVNRDDKEEVASAFQFIQDEYSRRFHEEPLNPFALMYFLPTKRNKRHKQCRHVVRSTLHQMIRKKREELVLASQTGSQVHEDLLKHIVKSFDEEHPNSDKEHVDNEIVDELVTFLFAGFDTTSIVLSYALYEISRRPEVEQGLLNESSKVLGNRTAVTYDDYTKLEYTQAVLREVLRVYPPAPLTTRTLTQDLVLGEGNCEVTLPAKTTVYIPIWWVHRSKWNWQSPETFDPSRFSVVGKGNHGEPLKDVKPYAWIPFSGGQRNCIGQRFALAEGTVALALLVRSFRFSNGPEKIKPFSTGVVQNPEGKSLFMTIRMR